MNRKLVPPRRDPRTLLPVGASVWRAAHGAPHPARVQRRRMGAEAGHDSAEGDFGRDVSLFIKHRNISTEIFARYIRNMHECNRMMMMINIGRPFLCLINNRYCGLDEFSGRRWA